MEEKRFSAGQTIFSEGDASDLAYVLRSGRVEILKVTPHGPVHLAVIGPGDVLGEMGLLDERPRSATARTLDDVVADAISPAAFAHMLLNEPARSMQLLRVLFERLRTMNRMVTEYTVSDDPGSAHPRVRLVPLTTEARAGLQSDGIDVARFPFKVGRRPEGRDTQALSFNDLELADVRPYFLSLNHFSLEVGSDGLVVRDRGSQHGTMVNGVRIGAGASRDLALLRSGENEVVAGAVAALFHRRGSPFRFGVVVG